MSMNPWLWAGLALLLLAGLSYTALSAWGERRWRTDAEALRARLALARRPPHFSRYSAAELQGLPLPVQRFFRAALTDGQPIVLGVDMEQEGTLNMSETGANWRAFRARQMVTTVPPGFDWDARVAHWPGVDVFVHDAYVGGVGQLHAAALGAVTLARQQGTSELAQGELMRYLAEAAWYPTALLPSQGVRWQAVDVQSARARLSDGDTTVELLFSFNSQGLIDSVRAESRARLVGGVTTPTPWRGRWSQYSRREGMQVPLEGEVAWLLLEGQQPYWRGRITALKYEWAPVDRDVTA